MMELRHLRALVAVADEGSFTRAAKVLGYTQSGISAQILELEEWLGHNVFERLGRKVYLTESGKVLIAYAERILRLTTEAEQAVRNFDAPAGDLSIGALESICAYVLPEIMESFSRKFPAVRLIVDSHPTAEICSGLEDNRIDVGFIAGTVNRPHLQTVPLVDEPLVMVASRNGPWADGSIAAAHTLNGVPLIIFRQSCTYQTLLERALAEGGVTPGPVMEVGSIEAIQRLVAVGMGVSLLPAYVLDNANRSRLTVFTLAGCPPTLTTSLVRHRNKYMTPALREFIALAQAHCARRACAAKPEAV